MLYYLCLSLIYFLKIELMLNVMIFNIKINFNIVIFILIKKKFYRNREIVIVYNILYEFLVILS